MAKRAKGEKNQRDNLLGQIDFHGLSQEEVLGQDGLVKQLAGRVLQKILEAEMGEHLGYEKHDNAGDNSGDSRNGHSEKRVLTENQEVAIRAPRDRNGTFEPKVIPKYQKRVPLFNDQIISLHSFGMTDRGIKSHLEKIYNAEVPPDLISRVHRGGDGGGIGLKSICVYVSSYQKSSHRINWKDGRGQLYIRRFGGGTTRALERKSERTGCVTMGTGNQDTGRFNEEQERVEATDFFQELEAGTCGVDFAPFGRHH
jgi:hypothetical protein